MSGLKIGIIADPIDHQYAGIHYYTLNLVSGLAQLLAEDDHLYIFRSKDNLLARVSQKNITEIVIPQGKSIAEKFWRLYKTIPRHAVDLDIQIMIEPAHFGPLNLPPHIMRVTVIHDLTPILFPQWHRWTSSFLQRKFLPSILRRTHLIITNSEHTKQDVFKHLAIPENKIASIPLGVDDDFSPKQDPLILGKYGVYLPYILFLGTLEPRKNLEKLIEAYDLYRDANPTRGEQLLLAGKKGWLKRSIKELRELSRYSDDVIYLGYIHRADMPYLYSDAEAFIYPSLYEGFGMPVLEAMACGVPVVTSDNSSLPEVAGKYGYLADANDPQALANQLSRAVLKDKFEVEVQIEYAQSFKWTNMSEQSFRYIKKKYLEEFQKV